MFTPKKIFAICSKKGFFCYYCGGQAETLDHLIPRIKNGNNDDGNLIPSCSTCNKRKRHFTIEQFRDIEARRINKMPRFSIEQKEFLKKVGISLPIYNYVFYYEKLGKDITNGQTPN